MYSLRIESQHRALQRQQQRQQQQQQLSAREFPPLPGSKGLPSDEGSDQEDDSTALQELLEENADSVEFSAGNPRVEHITGVVHLYRELPTPTQLPHGTQGGDGQQHQQQGLGPGGKPNAWGQTTHRTPGPASKYPEGRSPVLCCLAIPADMSVAEFCTFCGAYLPTIRSLRVLRREARQRVVCMVLIRFGTQQQADDFYRDFNCKPFSSLEPEIVCRLVFVREVQFTGPPGTRGGAMGTDGIAAGVAAAAAGEPAGDVQPQAQQQGGGQASGSTASAGAGGAAGPPSTPPGGPGKQGQGAGTSSGGANASSDSTNAGQGQASAAGGGGCGASGHVHHSHTHTHLGTELPTCPVCLERLDEHVSGIVTTVCNHQFHSECLQQWGDTSCPVCRYCSQPHAHSTSCSSCGATADLWICLICGHVGCGRYRAGHASGHWKSSGHCYALELETQRVWDYVGDNYVHRLIQSKTGGKLVEVPSPGPPRRPGHGRRRRGRHSCSSTGGRASSHGNACRPPPGFEGAQGGGTGSGSDYEGSSAEEEDEEGGAGDEELKEAMLASKLDHIAAEYNHLLASQLDSQRAYFEGLLDEQAGKLEEHIRGAEAAAEAAQAEAARAGAEAREAERKRQVSERKLADASASLAKVREERDFLKSLSDNLLANQKELRAQVDTAREESKSKDAVIQDLQEQVRDLMVFIEAQRTIASAGELEGATLLPVPEGAGTSRAGARRGQRKGGR